MSVASKRLSSRENIIWNASGSLIYLGCQWLLTVLVVRLSGDYSYAGLLALAMSIGNIFTSIAQYRMRAFQVSDVRHEYSAGQYLAFRFVTIASALTFSMVYATLTCRWPEVLCVFLYLLYKSVELVIDVLHGVDQQNDRMDFVGVSLAMRGVISVLSFSISLGLGFSLEVAVLSMMVLTIPVGLFYDYPRSSAFESLHPSICLKDVRGLLAQGFLPAISLLACSAVMTIPRQYLSILMGSEALGIYASVASPVAIVQAGASYIYSPLLGSFALAYSRGERRGFTQLFYRVLVALFASALLISAAFMLVGPEILALLYGQEIKSYSYLIVPMVVCSILTVLLWFLNDLLVAMRRIIKCFIGNAMAIVVAVPSTFVLVGMFGMNGVSFTGIVALGVASLASIAFVFGELGKMGDGDVEKDGVGADA